jgi:hypothetical protein
MEASGVEVTFSQGLERVSLSEESGLGKMVMLRGGKRRSAGLPDQTPIIEGWCSA